MKKDGVQVQDSVDNDSNDHKREQAVELPQSRSLV